MSISSENSATAPAAKAPAAKAAAAKPEKSEKSEKSALPKIAASPRAPGTKSALKRLRAEGQVPAIVYGDAQEPAQIAVPQLALQRLYQSGRMRSTPLELTLNGKAQRVIVRDLQLDAVRDAPIHADFLRLGAGASLEVNVPVRFLNAEESPGIKRGGVLNVVRREIALLCQADSIPEFIAVELQGSDIGHSFHISAIPLPEGVRPTIARDFTVATIAAPTKMEEPEPKPEDEDAEADAEAAEGEEAKDDSKAEGKADSKADSKTEDKADSKGKD